MNAGEDRAGVGEQTEIVFAEWPVDESGFANDVLAWDKTPLPGVGAVAAVVSHDEVFVRSYDTVIDGRKRIAGVILVDIRFVQCCSIDGDPCSDDADDIAGNGDNTLHIVQLGIKRVFEDDYVSSFRLVKEVGSFIDKDVFRVVQRRFHAWSVYAEILNREAQDEEHQ